MDQLKTFFTTRTALAMIVIGILLAGLVGGVYLTQRQTQLKSKAQEAGPVALSGSIGINPGVVTKNSSGSYPPVYFTVNANTGWKLFIYNGACSSCDPAVGWTPLNIEGTGSTTATWGVPQDLEGTYTIALFDTNVSGIADKKNITLQSTSVSTPAQPTTPQTPISPTQPVVPAPAPANPGAGGTVGSISSACPMTSLENISNENLIAKCTLAEIALLPNERLETFPMSILVQLPNSRLEQFSLGFLAKFSNERLQQLSLAILGKLPNDRLQQFSIEFLQKFSNDRLIAMSTDVLKQFPEERIRTFPCEVQIQLGYSCGDTLALSGTACYILSEDRADIASAASCDDSNAKAKGVVHSYSSDPSKTSYLIVNKTPGLKTIYVRFISKAAAGQAPQIADGFAQITLAPDPQVSTIACTQSATGSGTVVALAGTNFGSHAQQGQGSVTVNGSPAQIVTWDVTNPARNLIQATVPARLEGILNVDLKIDDGRSFTGGRCTIGTSSVQFTVGNQCLAPGKFSIDNMDAIIIQNITGAKPLVQTKINISRGVPNNFTPKLEANKNYSLILKGPRTLAKKVDFTTGQGTVNLGDIQLFIGDIAPFAAPDGAINALDNSEMQRQWNLLSSGDSLARTASLTEHGTSGIVNSLDYSCLKLGIGKQNDVDIKSLSQ